MFMKLAKNLNTIIFSTILFSASCCLFAEDNAPQANEADQAMISYKAKLEAFQAELDALKAVSSTTLQKIETAAPSKTDLDAINLVAKLADSTLLSYKSELESVKAELEAIKSQVASSSAQYQAEIAANKAAVSKIEEKTSDNEAMKLIAKLADSTILSYKSELETMKAELESIKAQVTASKQEAAALNENKIAYLDSLKEEFALMKDETAASSKKALVLEAELLAKSTTPVLSPDNTSDLYLPEAEKYQRNSQGQVLWQSKSEDQLLLNKTKNYNYDTFRAELSPFALHEWMKFSPEQKRKAMEYADRTQLSPDMAVFKVDSNY